MGFMINNRLLTLPSPLHKVWSAQTCPRFGSGNMKESQGERIKIRFNGLTL